MPANGDVYSGKEFSTYICEDVTGVGTFNTANGSTWKTLDIESFSFPSFNPTQEFEMRTGTGRVAQHGSMFTSDKGVTREIQISGRLTADALLILAENVLGVDSGGVECVVSGTHSPATLEHYIASPTSGTTIDVGSYEKSLSMYFLSPIPAESIKMKGCVCTSFAITADMGTAAGRFDFTATLQTGYAPAKGVITDFDPTAVSSVYYFLSDMGAKTITDNTSGFTQINPLITTFGLNIAGSAQMLGMQGANGDPEVIARQVPELEITYNLGIKYDSTTAPLVDEYRQTDQDIAFYIANVAESGTTFDASAVKLGIDINKSVLTAVDFDSGDIASLNITAKVVAGATSAETFVLQVA